MRYARQYKGKPMNHSTLLRHIYPVALSLFITLLAALPSSPVIAETIVIPLASQGQGQELPAMPRRGIEKSQVLAEFGEPASRGPAVGDPPITRWEYADYYVFFEYEHVIHSVVKHRPRNP